MGVATLSSEQAGGASICSSLTLGLSQGSCNSFLTMFNIMFKGFSTGVLLGDGVQSKEDVYKMKIPISTNEGSNHIKFYSDKETCHIQLQTSNTDRYALNNEVH